MEPTTNAALQSIMDNVGDNLTAVQGSAVVMIGIVVGIGLIVMAAKFLPKVAVGFFKSFAK